ncbi:MAG: metal ABC transporter substrate-binding protein [Trueperaceae bacterium]
MILRSQVAGISRLLNRALAASVALLILASTQLINVSHAQTADPLQVVVSIQPYQDIVKRVAGNRATVSTILPPGASPHSFDPTPSQAARIARADLVIMTGGLDLWLVRLVEATAPGTPVLTIIDAIDFSPLEGHEHANDHDHAEHGADDHDDHAEHEEHDRSPLGINSHIWLDPVLMLQAVDAIAAALTELDPAGADVYAANAATTRTELVELDAQLRELLAPVAGAPFVPFHDAWVYFAERYGLNIVVTLEPFPGREPSPRYVAEAVRDVISSGARAIFAERQLGSRSADVVAQSAGVAVAVLDPLGGEPGPVTYEALLLWNAAVIVAALAD